ncbi:signal peptide peptidase SppA [candidate division KSB1 bacterium]|nr:signal peptide peptidase SppA [candidate division KSB1 bacterium]
MTANPSDATTNHRKNAGCGLILALIVLVAIGVVITLIGAVAFFGAFNREKAKVEPKTALRLQISGPLNELATTDPSSLLFQGQPGVSYFDVLAAIRRAKTDDRISGIYLNSGDLRCGFAKAIEIRETLLDFKSSGKFIHAYIEFGDELDYLIASTADTLSMAPEGLIDLNGFAVSTLFWRGALDKIGVDIFVDQHEDYKSAAETISRTDFSRPARESIRELLLQRYTFLIDAIANSRNRPAVEVKIALEEGIYTSQGMLEHGLIDRIESKQSVLNRIAAQVDLEKPRLVNVGVYLNSRSGMKGETVNRDHEIALVIGSGTIISGDSGDLEPFSTGMLSSGSLIRSLRQARDNDRVSAIILRIDSPGGSVLASDEIWQELVEIRKDKPIFASMSDLAASGGYYIALACDTLIAHPATLTGSIGVISVIPNFSKLISKMGISADTIKTSPSSDFLDPFLPFTESDKSKFSSIGRKTYLNFVDKVADARELPFDRARELAKGRVWSGADAYSKGLVDTLGGLWTAIEMTKDYLGIPPEEKVRIRFYPEPESAFTMLMKLLTLNMQNPVMQNSSLSDPVRQIWAFLTEAERRQFAYLLQLVHLSRSERLLWALPESLSFDW